MRLEDSDRLYSRRILLQEVTNTYKNQTPFDPDVSDLFQTSAEDHVSCQAEGISGLLKVSISIVFPAAEPRSNGFNSSCSRWTNKLNPTDAYQVNPPGPKFQRCTKLYIASSALRFDFFVHRPQARSPTATLKFGDAGATSMQQGFDFIVHLR